MLFELIKKSSKYYILFLICLSIKLYAPCQSVEELTQKYPDVYAVILNHTEDTRIYMEDNVPKAETKVTKEILILNDKANGIYNKYYVYHGSFNELKDIEAYTKIPDGKGYSKMKVSEIKTESSSSNNVFYDDVKESRFDFPSITKGAIAHISYTITEEDAHMFTPFYVQSYLPVIQQKFTISYPSGIELLYDIRNDSIGNIQKEEYKKGRTHSVVFQTSHLKQTERYQNAPSRSYYEPHIIFRIGSYVNLEGKTVPFLKTLDDLYCWNYTFLNKILPADNKDLIPLVDSITKGIGSSNEKAQLIYKWVQANVKYVAFENGLEGFIPRPAPLVYNRRFGDCKDMANLITTMLRLAGCKAYLTWIGTRSIPYDYREVPLPITDNHMICALELDGKWIFLDGTDPNCIFGFPSSFIQGKQALVAFSEKEYRLLRVPIMTANLSGAIDSTFISLTSNGISGKMSVNYDGYYGIDVYNAIMNKDQEGKKNYVKFRMGKASNKFLLGDYTINPIDFNKKTINISANFEVPDYGKKIGSEWYINLILEKFFTNSNLADTVKQKMGIENDNCFTITQYTILNIPEGYSSSFIPDNFSISNELIDFSISYKKEPNKIIACQKYALQSLFMKPGSFALWNETMRKIMAHYKEQVVLQKS